MPTLALSAILLIICPIINACLPRLLPTVQPILPTILVLLLILALSSLTLPIARLPLLRTVTPIQTSTHVHLVTLKIITLVYSKTTMVSLTVSPRTLPAVPSPLTLLHSFVLNANRVIIQILVYVYQ